MRIYKRRQTVERITLIGPTTERGKWVNWCYSKGYRVVWSGPKPLRLGYVSHAKFKIVAEKVIG